LTPDAYTSDGCTGFQWAELIFPAIRACCVVHDAGGSDGLLLDCLQSSVPEWVWPFAAVGVALMVLFRPIVRWWRGRSMR
jgi:hypothetical protein